MMARRKLDLEAVKRSFEHNEASFDADSIPHMQVAVFVMCGGGLLGHIAAEQPADFYVDDRCGRLPFTRREITQAVQVLAIAAGVFGLDAHHLPAMPRFHDLGTF